MTIPEHMKIDFQVDCQAKLAQVEAERDRYKHNWEVAIRAMKHLEESQGNLIASLTRERQRMNAPSFLEFVNDSLTTVHMLGYDSRDDQVAKLKAENERLREALAGVLLFFTIPGENANDTFERIADSFYKDTGMLRPGKSEPLECCSSEREETRMAVYAEWCNGKIDVARAALGQKGEE